MPRPRSPDEAKIKTKMLYASSKDALRRALVGVASEIQGTDHSEIAYAEGRHSSRSLRFTASADSLSLAHACTNSPRQGIPWHILNLSPGPPTLLAYTDYDAILFLSPFARRRSIPSGWRLVEITGVP